MTCAERDCPIERLIADRLRGGRFAIKAWKKWRATVAQAVAHPSKWSMERGSQSFRSDVFNKAEMIIEASHLFFGCASADQVLVHPQSIIHSMIGFCHDSSILAHQGRRIYGSR
jgi:1-deoxy-D-xylulose-5-phosphate reductoisomerase